MAHSHELNASERNGGIVNFLSSIYISTLIPLVCVYVYMLIHTSVCGDKRTNFGDGTFLPPLGSQESIHQT